MEEWEIDKEQKNWQKGEKRILRQEKDGFLVISTAFCDESYKTEMIQKNLIFGLLTVKAQAFNDNWQYRYEIGEKISLKERFRKIAPSASEICMLMRQIEDIGKLLSGYLLSQEDLILDLECVYTDGKDCYFTYLPDYGKDFGLQLTEFLGELMGCINYEDRSSVSLVYLLHARVQQKDGNILSLRKLCDEILYTQEEEEKHCAVGQDINNIFTPSSESETALPSAWNTESWKKGKKSNESSNSRIGLNNKTADVKKQVKDTENHFFAKIKTCKEKIAGLFRGFSNLPSNTAEFEDAVICCESSTEYGSNNMVRGELQEDTVLLKNIPEESGDTVLLNKLERSYCLEPMEKQRECILLTDYPFWIGKEKFETGYSFVDSVISRKHAKIWREGNEYFLVDTGSLNGTTVEGKRLMPHECRCISPGDVIGFAEIYYTFTCL
mgnify:CR=1 FL=1